jgi:hypothetical protein
MRHLPCVLLLAFAAIIMAVQAWAGQGQIPSQTQEILGALVTISNPKLFRLFTDIATAMVGGAFSMRAAHSMATTVRRSRQSGQLD